MTTVRSRTKLKKAGVLDIWTTKELLVLASSVLRNGYKNWSIVSQSMQPFRDAHRPTDFFSHDKCELQYIQLLLNFENMKRKKRSVKKDDHLREIHEIMVQKLTQERVAELENTMVEEQRQYLKLKREAQLEEDAERKKTVIVKRKDPAKQTTVSQEKKDKQIFKVPAPVTKPKPVYRGSSRQSSPSSSVPKAADNMSKAIVAKEQQKTELTKNTIGIRKDVLVKNPHPPSSPTTRVIRATKSPLLTSLLQSQSPTVQIPKQPVNKTAPISSNVRQSVICFLNSTPGVATLVPAPAPRIPQNVQRVVLNTVSPVPDSHPKTQPTIITTAGASTLTRMLELPHSLSTTPVQTVPYSAKPTPVLYVLPPSVTNLAPTSTFTGDMFGQQRPVGNIQTLGRSDKFIGLLPLQETDKGSQRITMQPVEFIIEKVPTTLSNIALKTVPSASAVSAHTVPNTLLQTTELSAQATPEEVVVPDKSDESHAVEISLDDDAFDDLDITLPDDLDINLPCLDLNDDLNLFEDFDTDSFNF